MTSVQNAMPNQKVDLSNGLSTLADAIGSYQIPAQLEGLRTVLLMLSSVIGYKNSAWRKGIDDTILKLNAIINSKPPLSSKDLNTLKKHIQKLSGFHPMVNGNILKGFLSGILENAEDGMESTDPKTRAVSEGEQITALSLLAEGAFGISLESDCI